MVWLNLIMAPRKVTGEGGWDNIAQRKRLCFSTGGPGFDSQRLRNVNDVVEIYPWRWIHVEESGQRLDNVNRTHLASNLKKDEKQLYPRMWHYLLSYSCLRPDGDLGQVSLKSNSGFHVFILFYPSDSTSLAREEIKELSGLIEDFQAIKCKVFYYNFAQPCRGAVAPLVMRPSKVPV